jgi:outer membrane lipoprotein-sorting protein
MRHHFSIRRASMAAALLLTALAVPSAQTDQAERRIDPKALGLLQAMDDAFARAEGLVANYRSESFRPNGQPANVETTTLRLGRPNVYVVETSTRFGEAPGGSTMRRILASDGTTRFDVTTGNPARCSVSVVAPLNDTREIDTFNPFYWSFYDLGQWQIRSAMAGHWSTKWRMNDPGLRSVRYVGRDTVAGVAVDVVEWTYTVSYNRKEDDPLYTSRLAIGPDHFVRRIETTSTSKNEYEGRRIVETVTDLRTTARPTKDEFAYRPPAGTDCKPVNQEDVYTTGQYADLPIGSKAPDFALKTARGETLRLSTFLAQHKVVLMNYWGYG